MSDRNGHLVMSTRDEAAGTLYPLPGTNTADRYGVTAVQASSRFADDKRGRIYAIYYASTTTDNIAIEDHDGQVMFELTHAATAAQMQFGPLGFQFTNGFRVTTAGGATQDFAVFYEVD